MLLGFVAAVARETWPHRADVIASVSSALTSPTPADEAPVAEPEPARPVYRHSVVPGGAYSRAEVADAIKRDAVVAAHYQDIDVDKVHATTARVARAVYVSYRVGNQVYWTKNRVRLAAGETVLTDGDTEIRARCGNLVSDQAQQPVAAAEPPLAALDEPETGSSTTAGARGPEGALALLPFLAGPNGAGSGAFAGFDPAAGGASLDAPPMWFSGGGGTSPNAGSSTGTGGTSLVAPFGSSPRNNNNGNAGGSKDEGSNGGGSNGGGSNGGGSNGGGSNGGGSNGGGSNGGGSSGGGSNGGGSNGGGSNGGGSNGGGGNGGGGNGGGGNGGGGNEQPPLFVPPTTTGEVPFTTTGGTETTTTGNETTGGETHTVPEPGTLVLFGLGACGVVARALRARRR